MIEKRLLKMLKPFKEGAFVKECVMSVAAKVFPEKMCFWKYKSPNKNSDSGNLFWDLLEDVKKHCKIQLVVFNIIPLRWMKALLLKIQSISNILWGINSKVIIPEKLVKLVPFKGSITGKLDVFLDFTSKM